MPATPHTVSGTVTSAAGVLQANALIKFTTSEGTAVVVADSSGQFVYNIANIGYTAGETVTYVANGEFYNETYTSTFVVSGDTTSLTITLAVRSDIIMPPANRTIVIYNVGGKPVTTDNPFPVSSAGQSSDFDLVNNPATTWTITRSDFQPDSETIVIASGTYKRTFTYNSDNVMITRSAWVLQ